MDHSIQHNRSLLTILCCRYAQFGEVSPKVDVYAFGVVIYELISAKEAIVKPNATTAESKGLVALVNCLYCFYRLASGIKENYFNLICYHDSCDYPILPLIYPSLRKFLISRIQTKSLAK